MPSKRDYPLRPLIGALLVSILLHALLLFADRLHFEGRDTARRIILQATLQRVPAQVRVTPDPVPPAAPSAALPCPACR